MRKMAKNPWAWMMLFAAVFAFSGVAGAAQGFYTEEGLNMELIHLGYNFSDTWGIGFQWGAAAGEIDENLGGDEVWSQGYMDISARYTHAQNENWDLYGELGFGNYVLLAESDDIELVADPVIGWRIALGGMYYINNFYLGPELSYHNVEYDDGEIETDIWIGGLPPGDYDFDDIGGGDMLVLQFKAGYHFGR
jgi:hypothetical protein